MYSDKLLKEMGDLLQRKSREFGRPIYLLADEPYKKIIFEGWQYHSPLRFYRNTILATSFSKDLSVAGERIGYLAVSPLVDDWKTLIDAATFCNRILGYINAPALMQRAVARLLEESVDISVYQKRRNMLCDGLASFGYDFIKPKGAFYLFPRTPIEDDFAFVRALQEENILTVPGSGFGGPGHIRIAYCVSDETIEKALPGFEKVIKKY